MNAFDPAFDSPQSDGTRMGGRRRIRRFALALLAATLPGTMVAVAQPLSPRVNNWEDYFRIDWQASEDGRRPSLSGYVWSVNKYGARWMQLLVDRVDSSGALLDQRLVWLPSEVPRGSRVYFEVPVAPAAKYRVSVFAYEFTPRP
jgi:hypothetical protein